MSTKVVELPVKGRYTFTVSERLGLIRLLPQKGNIFMLRQLREVAETLSLSDAELKTLNPEQVEGSFSLSQQELAKIKDKALVIPEPTLQLIQANLQAMNQKETLPMECLSIYEKLIPEEVRNEDTG